MQLEVNKRLLLIFNFENKNKDDLTFPGFCINLLPNQNIINTDPYLETIGFYSFILENEELYGVHDVRLVSSEEPITFQFDFYEVKINNHLICIENIRQFFISKDCDCSEPYYFMRWG